MTGYSTPNDVYYFYSNVLSKQQRRTWLFFWGLSYADWYCFNNCCVNIPFAKGFSWDFITRYLDLRNQSAFQVYQIFLSNNSAYSEVKIKGRSWNIAIAVKLYCSCCTKTACIYSVALFCRVVLFWVQALLALTVMLSCA